MPYKQMNIRREEHDAQGTDAQRALDLLRQIGTQVTQESVRTDKHTGCASYPNRSEHKLTL